MRVFIAGIMQGSRQDALINNQNYRTLLTNSLQSHLENVEIIDPWTLHPQSLNYTDDQIRETFISITTLAANVDVLIAYLPQASMGTAVELWTAYQAGVPAIAVSPLSHNWLLKVTTTQILPDLDSLLQFIASGQLQRLVDGLQPPG